MDDLRTALAAGLAGARTADLAAHVDRLIGAYRSHELPATPILATARDAAAYAAYRMPATAAVARAALAQVAAAMPDLAPARLVDLGAGTGAMAWAAAAELPSLTHAVLLEQSAEAIAFGTAIARSGPPLVAGARWRRWQLPAAAVRAADPRAAGPRAVDARAAGPRAAGPRAVDARAAEPADVPAADVATVGYVLGELTEAQQARLVDLAIAAAPTVVVVEPGTPAGHRRVLAARDRLLAAGLTVAAPCPHQLACPLAGDDWCHFAERVERSALHRRAKGAELAWEDEKFAFVAATRLPVTRPAAGRVIRRPQQRKGLVTLDVCAADGGARRELVAKRAGDAYRAARKAEWGDRLPLATP